MTEFSDLSMAYDREKGELSIIDGHLEQVIKVRQGIVDAMIRQAAIVELEKLGYTVISPEET